jgi:hypothetical protein
MEEIWKEIRIDKFDHECFVSNKGFVKSHKGNILAFINMGDCLRINLKSDKKQRRMAVHRLVAYAFLGVDIKDATLVVKHIDGDIYNNSVENLKVVNRASEATLKKRVERESGVNNINWYPPLNKWKLAYRIRRKKQEFFKHLGYFHSLQDAKNVHDLWFNSFKNIIPDVKYPGLLYLEGERKWRVDVFDKQGNLYHIDHYKDEKEALEDWKLFHRAVNHKH